MNPSPDEIQKNIYMQMSMAQKWAEANRLREIAWELKSAAIRLKHPDWGQEQVQSEVKKIFLYATT